MRKCGAAGKNSLTPVMELRTRYASTLSFSVVLSSARTLFTKSLIFVLPSKLDSPHHISHRQGNHKYSTARVMLKVHFVQFPPPFVPHRPIPSRNEVHAVLPKLEYPIIIHSLKKERYRPDQGQASHDELKQSRIGPLQHS